MKKEIIFYYNFDNVMKIKKTNWKYLDLLISCATSEIIKSSLQSKLVIEKWKTERRNFLFCFNKANTFLFR